MSLFSSLASRISRAGLRRLAPTAGTIARRKVWARPLMKIALIGTPRSGNTWLRRLLATGYAMGEIPGGERSVHEVEEVDWTADLDRSIVQVHARRSRDLEDLFAQNGVRVIVPLRNPLDVLISILQYATHVHDTHRWLGGEGGDEVAIRGLDPNHPTFLDYALGSRPAALLAVSPEWRESPGAVSLAYEDLVAEPLRALDSLAAALGREPTIPWAEALTQNTMARLRQSHGFGHIWQGRPGLWRSLLTPESVRILRPLLDATGTSAEADPSLTPERALAQWRSLN